MPDRALSKKKEVRSSKQKLYVQVREPAFATALA